MIDNVIMLYRKAKMGAMSVISDADESIYTETDFYDTGTIQSKVTHLQKDIKRLENDINNHSQWSGQNAADQKYLKELVKQREALVFEFVFLTSNSFNNLLKLPTPIRCVEP